MENSKKLSAQIFEHFLESIFHIGFHFLKIDFWNSKTVKNFILITLLNSPCKNTLGYKFLIASSKNSSKTSYVVASDVTKINFSIFGIQNISENFIECFFWNLHPILHKLTNFHVQICFIWYLREKILIFMKIHQRGLLVLTTTNLMKSSRLCFLQFFSLLLW